MNSGLYFSLAHPVLILPLKKTDDNSFYISRYCNVKNDFSVWNDYLYVLCLTAIRAFGTMEFNNICIKLWQYRTVTTRRVCNPKETYCCLKMAQISERNRKDIWARLCDLRRSKTSAVKRWFITADASGAYNGPAVHSQLPQKQN